MTRTRWLTLGLLGGSMAVAALSGEVAVRVLAASQPGFGEAMHRRDPFAVLIEPHGEFGFRQRPGAVFRYGNGTAASANADGYRGPVAPIEKPAGGLRVVLLGGSTTHGWGVPDSATIDAFMRRELQARFPDRRIDVINLAFDGYDSYQDLERMRSDGLPRGPDVVIINAGINDVRNARYADLQEHDPRTLLFLGEVQRLREERARGGPTSWTRLKHYSFLVRAGGYMRDALLRHTPVEEVGPAPTVTPNLEAATYFERNVARIIDLARAAGASVLLSTPPSSLRSNYAPDATSHRTYWINDAETTQVVRDSLDARLRRLADAEASDTMVRYVPHDVPADEFLDDCHLTPAGNGRMAADFVAAMAGIPALGLRAPRQ